MWKVKRGSGATERIQELLYGNDGELEAAQGRYRHPAPRSEATGEAAVKSQELSEEVRRIWERELSPEEFHRQVAAAIADEEDMQQQAELCAWFSRRYPTASERLRYARRKYAEWTRRPPNDSKSG